MKKLFPMFIISMLVLSFCSSAFAWAPLAEGKPDTFDPGASRGYYIWHDDNGLHMWTTTRGKQHEFSGVIRTNGKFINTHSQRLEMGDFYKVDSDRDMITFKFTTAGGEDGLNFRIAGGNYADFDLFIDGHRIDPREIHIGDRGWHPRHSDFRLHR